MPHYVHGYSERETERLRDQAATVMDLIHQGTSYPAGALVLEAGCGVGAQTVTLAANSPEARFISIDVSNESLRKARSLVEKTGCANVRFQLADLYQLPFADNLFDHIFVCFVLEHLIDPRAALESFRRVLKPGGTITVMEGDHGSCYWHPETDASRKAWQCLIDSQASLGGNSLIGRELFPLLDKAGFTEIWVSPKMIYMDSSLPDIMDGFVRKTIIPMVAGVQEQALSTGMIDETTWNQGLRDLGELADGPAGVFCYTFFKAIGCL